MGLWFDALVEPCTKALNKLLKNQLELGDELMWQTSCLIIQ
jgi:hypothetical protein